VEFVFNKQAEFFVGGRGADGKVVKLEECFIVGVSVVGFFTKWIVVCWQKTFNDCHYFMSAVGSQIAK